jgi:hypothetical protein
MHEGGHWPRGSVDHGDGPAVRRLHVDPVTVEIRIGLELGQPVRQLQRRIPERAGQRVAQRGRRGVSLERNEQVADRRPRQARPQQAREEAERRHRDAQHGELGDEVRSRGAVRRGQRDRRGAGSVHRRQGAPGRGARAPPAPDQHADEDQEHARLQRARGGEEDIAERGVVGDLQHVARARPRAQPHRVGRRHQHHRHVAQPEDGVRRGRRPSPRGGLEPAGREAQQHVHEQRQPRGLEGDGEREHERGARAVERGEKPGEPERHQDRPEARFRPPPPRVQANRDVAPADERPEHGERVPVPIVIAREDQRAQASAANPRRGGERRRRRCGQSSKTTSAGRRGHEPILTHPDARSNPARSEYQPNRCRAARLHRMGTGCSADAGESASGCRRRELSG